MKEGGKNNDFFSVAGMGVQLQVVAYLRGKDSKTGNELLLVPCS